MNKIENTKRHKQRLARLELVAPLYKRGYSLRQIVKEVKAKLNLETYVVSTCYKDVQYLLKEWRETRINDLDANLQLELERIDDAVRELWQEWEKSKMDYSKTSTKRKGMPRRNRQEDDATEGRIETLSLEEQRTEVVMLGDPRYITEIRNQLMERRKILGLYAVSKLEVTGKDGAPLVSVESMTAEEIQAEIERIQKSMQH